MNECGKISFPPEVIKPKWENWRQGKKCSEEETDVKGLKEGARGGKVAEMLLSREHLDSIWRKPVGPVGVGWRLKDLQEGEGGQEALKGTQCSQTRCLYNSQHADIVEITVKWFVPQFSVFDLKTPQMP